MYISRRNDYSSLTAIAPGSNRSNQTHGTRQALRSARRSRRPVLQLPIQGKRQKLLPLCASRQSPGLPGSHRRLPPLLPTDPAIRPKRDPTHSRPMGQRLKKKELPKEFLLAQEAERQRVMGWFQGLSSADGNAVAKLELLVRAAVFKTANEFVGWLLQQAVEAAQAAYQPKAGQHGKGAEKLRVQGIFGTFELERDYYYHAGKKQGHYPADAALGLEVGYTPALARLMCLEGADEATYLKAQRHLEQTGGISVEARQIQRVVQRVGGAAQSWQAQAPAKAPYLSAQRHLEQTGGISVEARQIQRVVQRVGGAAQSWQEREPQPGSEKAPILYVSADGTGVPMVSEEVQGRHGKQADGTARTRQAYLGCVFTQHRVDEQGRPVRDWDSTTYVSSFKSIDEFGPVLRREALRRGVGAAGKVVLLIDGATGLENMGKSCFKDAVQIVDFYHAMEHAGKVLGALIGKEHPEYKKRLRRWAGDLLKDKVQNLIKQARRQSAGEAQARAVEEALGYFERNVSRMKYGTFRAAGYFIGSGVVEAGCKTVIGARCKQSGMFWSESGAQNVLALRCINASRRLDEFWKYRLNQHAARNDALALAA